MNASHPLRRLRAAAPTWGLVLLCLCGAWVGGAQAAPPSATAAQVWHTVGDHRLASLRGGFNLGGGLEVSFGITRSVFINGQLVTETTLNLGRMADITPEWAAQLRQELQSIRVVQNGPGNLVIAGPEPTTSSSANAAAPSVGAIAGTAAGTVIQNSLNNQQILHQTIINASSNALGLLRLSSLHDSLSEAIRQSVGQR